MPLPSYSNSQPLFSSESDRPITAREKLQEFFASATPPNLPDIEVSSKTGNGSTTTRTPRFFDLHLHKDLQLKQVVLLKHLPSAIAKVCDDILAVGSGHHIHYTNAKGFPPPDEEEELDVDHVDITLAGEPIPLKTVVLQADDINRRSYTGASADSAPRVLEKQVVDAYQTGDIRRIVCITSTLLFDGAPWKNVLRWHVRSHTPQPHARADGFLSFWVRPREGVRPAFVKRLRASDHTDIKLIKKHQLHHLVLWEFKNGVAADESVMHYFKAHVGPFNWQMCTLGQNADFVSPDTSCTGSMHNTNGIYTICGRRTGLDAENREFIDNAILTGFESDGYVDLGTFKWSGFDSRPELLCRKPENEVASTKPEVLKKGHDTTIKRVLQQMWAEAVLNDSTFIVLHSGKFEIFFIRDRDTGTFFMSDVLRVKSAMQPSFQKLTTGLFIHAYRDALARALQLEALNVPHSPRDVWPALYRLEFSENHEAYRPDIPSSNLLPRQSNDLSVYALFLEELRTKSRFKIHMPQRLVPSSRTNFHVMKRLPDAASLPAGPQPSKVSDWTIHASSDATRLSAKVYEVVISNPKESYSLSKKVVVKFGCNDRDKLDLLAQHNFLEYVSARRFSAIKSFGIFELPQKNIWALLMEHGGISCDKILKTGRRVPAYFRTHNYKFKKALAEMHGEGVLHGNLDQSHLLMNVRGDISWISGREFRGGDIGEPVDEGENGPASSKGSQKKTEMGNLVKWTTVWSKPKGKSTRKTN